MVLNTTPGHNSWVGAEPVNSALVEACGAKVRAQQSLLGTYESVRPLSACGKEAMGRPRWDTDPRPERTGVHFQAKPTERLARVNPSQLATIVSQGYGRVPTTFVHTSTHAAPAGELRSPAVLRTRQQSHLYSFSAPCSPSADPRTLLYSRGPTTQPQPQQFQQQYVQQQPEPSSNRAVPAVDLLDRLALLRRITPTTQPSPRPHPLQRHTAAVEHTRAPAPYGSGSGREYEGLGYGFECGQVESARPLAAVPAPGWHYYGDCKSTQAGGDGCVAQETSCQTEGPMQDVVVVVTNEHAPPALYGEDTEELLAPRKPRPAFRPAGQAKPPRETRRPKSAPAARRCSFGRRECGCPKPATNLAEAQRAARAAAQAAKEAAQREQVTVVVTSPRACSDCCGTGAATPRVECVVCPLRGHTDRDVVLVKSPRAGNNGEIDAVAVRVDHRNGPAVTGSYPRSPRRSPSGGLAAAAATASDQAAAVATGVQTEAEAAQPQGNTFSITLPNEGPRDASFVISANLGSIPSKPPALPIYAAIPPGPSMGAAGPTIRWASPVAQQQQGGRHASELAALSSEIQRREGSFKSMLGELERITAKCSDLASSIAGAGGRQHAAKRAETTGYSTYSYKLPAAAALVQAAGSGGSQQQEQQLSSASSLNRSSSDGTVDAIPAASAALAANGSSSKLADSPGRAEGAAAATPGATQPSTGCKEEWSWESLMEFERTIREQHRKLVEQGLLPPDLS